jgi:hypothetical protein
MRKFLILGAAACLLAVPAVAGELRAQSTEFSSQGVYIGGPGVGVRVGPDRRDRWRERRYWREREVRSGCKTVTVRETMPNGSVVTRTRSRC